MVKLSRDVGVDADPLGGFPDQRADVDVGVEGVAAQQLGGDLHELVGRGRDVEVQDAGVALPAQIVVNGADDEDLVALGVPVAADAFEDAGAVVQRVGEDADMRFSQGDVTTVEINNCRRIRFIG